MVLSESPARPAGRTRPAGGTRRSRRYRLFGGGTSGNEQLTAVAGALLLVLFAALGITIIRIGQLLWWHLFLGVLLVGPVALKLGSTSYRFTRYYTANAAYRRKGPPDPVMRMLAPFVVLTTVAVFFTGLLLLVDGPYASGTLRLLHKLTFFMWLIAVGLHVLGHLVELPGSLKAVSRDEVRTARLPGSSGRTLAVAGSLIVGLVLALLFLPDAHSWTAVGLHPFQHFGDH
ncbi:MAG TPA: hypothetical protein VMV16_03385 [Solirubrobacteraceae bacterium]|nr:hypothetical protein [Solirubrobacteraceae bacterium]